MSGALFVVGLAREARLLERAKGLKSSSIRIGTADLGAALALRPAALISFGLCGGLDPGLEIGDLIVATEAIFADEVWETDLALSARLARVLPEARRGAVLGSATIVGDVLEKAAQFGRTGALAADMESHIAAAAAARAETPFAVVRVVSDAAGDSLPRAAQAGFRADGTTDVGAVIANLVRRPWELPALLEVAQNAALAFKTLETAARRMTKVVV